MSCAICDRERDKAAEARAADRLIDAHRDEYERLVAEERKAL